jgi:hypothetical protein
MERQSKTKSTSILVSGMMLFALALSIILTLKSTPATAQGSGETTEIPPEYLAQIPQEIKDQIRFFGGGAMLARAKSLAVTTVEDKFISGADGGSPPGNAKAKKLLDVGIGIHPTKHENEPTVAANPKDKKKFVAGSHFSGPPAPTANRCVGYTSSDRGETWSAPFAMPHLSPLSACSDPVLAYAPDGSRVYYAYMDIKQIFTPGPPARITIDLDIVVSYSDDDGATWTGPIIALDGSPTIIIFTTPMTFILGFDYDKPWIGTHVDDKESTWVYVTATRFDNFLPFGIHIAFARSGNQGVLWSGPTLLESGSGLAPAVVVQGSRPIGGVGGEVLVAWYNSGTDGFLSGSFRIRTRRSSNNGATFDPAVNAAVDSFELPFWLGPFAFYHRWWGGMFPDVEIDAGGEAHIVYTHDPVAGSTTPEDGDIRYVSSGGPPYTFWSLPVTVNDDGLGRAQGYAALETQHGGNSSTLHAIWEDHRLSPDVPAVFPNSPNLYYDIFYSRKPPGGGWFNNFRVTETSSINDFIFIGDYNDLSAVNKVFAIFTDRRHRTSIFDFEDNVFGSQIIPGGGAP